MEIDLNELVADVQKPKKKGDRRRSSFCATRLSLAAAFVDPEPEEIIQHEVKENDDRPTSPVCPEPQLTRTQERIQSKTDSYLEELAAWEIYLRKVKEEKAKAKESLSDISALKNKQASKQMLERARKLCGDRPDYAKLLRGTAQEANDAFARLNEVCCVVEILDQVAQKADKLLTKYADNLGEISIPNTVTPRTQIIKRLAVSTPKPPKMLEH